MEKDRTKARNFVEAGNGKQALNLLIGKTGGGSAEEGLIARFEKGFAQAEEDGYLPKGFNAEKNSQLKLDLYKMTCSASIQASSTANQKVYCPQVLEIRGGEGDVDALRSKGDLLMREEKYEEATRVYQDAFENGGRQSQEVLDKLRKAQRLLKQSKQKDYYKVRVMRDE